MKIEREENVIYELDPDGVNRWSFNIQAGYGLDGIKQPQSVIDKVATLMNNAENLRVVLTNIMEIFDTSEDDDVNEKAYKMLLTWKAKALLNKLN